MGHPIGKEPHVWTHAPGTRAYPGSHDTTRVTLSNGITLLMRENPISPAVVVSGYLEVGSQDEPAELAGLANFAADVAERGTRRRSFDALYEEIESIAAVFGVHSGTHITSFGGRGLADSLELLLNIISDVLREPAFLPEQVEKARAGILTDLHEREHSTSRMAGMTFNALAYPNSHPYHWSNRGYTETINRIGRDDLMSFHQKYYTPRGMTLVVAGGIQRDQAIRAVEDAFADWGGDRPPRSVLPPVRRMTERRELRLSVEDKTQSNLVMGWPGPERAHADFIPAFVTNTLLGVFGLYGRLGKSVREQSGLAYYAHSQIDGGTGPGPWRISAGADPGNIDQAVELIREELRKLREVLVEASELADSQSFLTGSLPLHLETNEGVAQTLINIERYGLGLDYLYQYSSLINAVTPDDVQTVATRWLDPEAFALAIAEPARLPT